tara:strand:- start:822 stop:1589 length:768 start_codon:yes stop_codon:yes gene_type:complete
MMSIGAASTYGYSPPVVSSQFQAAAVSPTSIDNATRPDKASSDFPPVDQMSAGDAAGAKPPEEKAVSGSQDLEQQKRAQLADAEAELQRVTQEEVSELAARDREVRSHEQAHMAAGGQYAGSVQYDYKRGPDGRLYAVGGEVGIDTSRVPGDPQATIDKMEQVRRAALAPAEPSGQDLAVAAQAAQVVAQARAELATKPAEDAKRGDVSASEESDQESASGDDTVDEASASSRDLSLYRNIAANAADIGSVDLRA